MKFAAEFSWGAERRKRRKAERRKKQW